MNNMTTTTLTLEQPRASRSVWQRILTTEPTTVATILRIVLGLVILPHGAQKILGWFGGYGFDGTVGFIASSLGVPSFIAALSPITEFFLAIALIVGLGTRFAAFAMAINMIVAASVHFGNGFFMNWTGAQAGEGFEYHLLTIAMSVALVISGGGKWSLDRVINERS
jgi:putative oxidoreductase